MKPIQDDDDGRGVLGGFLSSEILLTDGPMDVVDGGKARTICLDTDQREFA